MVISWLPETELQQSPLTGDTGLHLGCELRKQHLPVLSSLVAAKPAYSKPCCGWIVCYELTPCAPPMGTASSHFGVTLLLEVEVLFIRRGTRGVGHPLGFCGDAKTLRTLICKIKLIQFITVG